MRLVPKRGALRDFRTSPGTRGLVNRAATVVADRFGAGYGVNSGSGAGSRYRAYVRAKGVMARRRAKDPNELLKKAASIGLKVGGSGGE